MPPSFSCPCVGAAECRSGRALPLPIGERNREINVAKESLRLEAVGAHVCSSAPSCPHLQREGPGRQRAGRERDVELLVWREGTDTSLELTHLLWRHDAHG